MIDHIDAVIAGDVSGFIAGAVDAVLPAKGKQILEEGMLEGIIGKINIDTGQDRSKK